MEIENTEQEAKEEANTGQAEQNGMGQQATGVVTPEELKAALGSLSKSIIDEVAKVVKAGNGEQREEDGPEKTIEALRARQAELQDKLRERDAMAAEIQGKYKASCQNEAILAAASALKFKKNSDALALSDRTKIIGETPDEMQTSVMTMLRQVAKESPYLIQAAENSEPAKGPDREKGDRKDNRSTIRKYFGAGYKTAEGVK